MAQNNPPLTHTHTFPACLCVPAHPPERAEHRSGQRWLSPPVSLSISILCVRVSAVRVINVDDINSVKYLAAIWSVTASGSPVHVAFAPHSPQHPSKAKMCKKWNLKKKKTPRAPTHIAARHRTWSGHRKKRHFIPHMENMTSRSRLQLTEYEKKKYYLLYTQAEECKALATVDKKGK